MSGKLIVVGTPIGNLSDFSPRAKEALSSADFIAAEDTRVTVKLLNKFGIKKPLVSYYEHNKYGRGVEIVERIESGETCAIVSDAGMPAISDPGELLVAQCAEKGIEVSVVPGPCAAVSALAVSGLPSGRFTFEGFLSVSKKSRREHLESLKSEQRTMIFYEAPHKLSATLRDMLKTFGDRRLVLARELTKIHEEIIRTSLAQAAKHYESGGAKGEFVLIIEGAPFTDRKDQYKLADAVEIAGGYLKDGLSASEAAKNAAAETGFKKNEIYKEIAAKP